MLQILQDVIKILMGSNLKPCRRLRVWRYVVRIRLGALLVLRFLSTDHSCPKRHTVTEKLSISVQHRILTRGLQHKAHLGGKGGNYWGSWRKQVALSLYLSGEFIWQCSPPEQHRSWREKPRSNLEAQIKTNLKFNTIWQADEFGQLTSAWISSHRQGVRGERGRERV